MQSSKRKPVVPISETLAPELERAVQESQSGFVIEYEGRPVQSIKTAFRRACRIAKLEDVTPYTLRHSGATLLAAAGVPLRQIAGVLGHTQQRTTELYAKHSPEYLQEASNAMNRILGTIEGGYEVDVRTRERNGGRCESATPRVESGPAGEN